MEVHRLERGGKIIQYIETEIYALVDVHTGEPQRLTGYPFYGATWVKDKETIISELKHYSRCVILVQKAIVPYEIEPPKELKKEME